MSPERFDQRYFERYYYARSTRVAAPRDYLARARLIAAWAGLCEIRIRHVLDAGAGAGFFARALAEALPTARITGLDLSAYACARYGWQHVSLNDFSPGRRYDLVVCSDVLQYLSHAEAARAIDKLAALSQGLLYFMAPTREDWPHNCDQEKTDTAVQMRAVAWYRRRLRAHFRRLGGGVYVTHDAAPVMFALDDCG